MPRKVPPTYISACIVNTGNIGKYQFEISWNNSEISWLISAYIGNIEKYQEILWGQCSAISNDISRYMCWESTIKLRKQPLNSNEGLNFLFKNTFEKQSIYTPPDPTSECKWSCKAACVMGLDWPNYINISKEEKTCLEIFQWEIYVNYM